MVIVDTETLIISEHFEWTNPVNFLSWVENKFEPLNALAGHMIVQIDRKH